MNSKSNVTSLRLTLGYAALLGAGLCQPLLAQEGRGPWNWEGDYGANRDAQFYADRDWKEVEEGSSAVLSLRLGERLIATDIQRVPYLGAEHFRIQVPAEYAQLLPILSMTLELGDARWTLAAAGTLTLDQGQEAREGDQLTLGAVLEVQPYEWGTRCRAIARPVRPCFQSAMTFASLVAAAPGGNQANISAIPLAGVPITGFAPQAANEGDPITVSGNFAALLATFTAEDALVIAPGYRGFHGRVNNLQATQLAFGLDVVSEYALDQSFDLVLGYGDTITPTISGVSVPGIWVMGAPFGFPTGDSNQVLGVNGGSIYQLCEPVPEPCRRTPVQLDGTELNFALPGFGVCPGDSISMWFRIKIDGVWYTIDTAPSTPFNQALSWATVGELIIANMLNQAFLFHQDGPLPLRASFDAVDGELILQGWDYQAGSALPVQDYDIEGYFRVCWDESQSILVSEVQGYPDAYVTGGTGPGANEPLTPWGPYLDWAVTNIIGQSPSTTYDTSNLNKYMLETFDNFGSTFGEVRSAHLTLRMKGTAGQTWTDSLHLGWNETSTLYSWGVSLNQMPDIGTQWDTTDDITICLDLSKLLKNGTITDIVDLLNDPSGRFHTRLQDDSTIDFMELKVWRCLQ